MFHLRENGKGGLGTPTPPQKKASYLRRRRAAKPANAGRESVAVAGSGMVSAFTSVAERALFKMLIQPRFQPLLSDADFYLPARHSKNAMVVPRCSEKYLTRVARIVIFFLILRFFLLK